MRLRPDGSLQRLQDLHSPQARGNGRSDQMVRIVTAVEPLITTVTVDGQVNSESVEAIDTCVKQAIARGRPVHLFLRDVFNIDESGRCLLARVAANGVHLSAGGLYTSHVVAEISRAAAAGKSRFACGQAMGTAEAP